MNCEPKPAHRVNRQFPPGCRVKDEFLGCGTVKADRTVNQIGMVYVLWDNTPPLQYNCGTNPSPISPDKLTRIEVNQ